jgi:hypothetical protein
MPQASASNVVGQYNGMEALLSERPVIWIWLYFAGCIENKLLSKFPSFSVEYLQNRISCFGDNAFVTRCFFNIYPE